MQTKTSNFETLMDMIRESVHECYEDEANTIKIEITEEGFHDILQGQQEEVSRNGKCLRYCILKHNNLFTPGNLLSEEDVLKFFENLFAVKAIDTNVIQQIIEKCDEAMKHEEDRCERAHTASVCILKQLKQFEIIDSN
uniref:Uncharacterized protein n=1 Tax=Glossina pallidipes TaxID=7398 RepID=A0A1A9ZLV6_GLOPL